MAQHLAVRQSARQDRMHSLHVEQALARESSLAKKILVDLGGGGAVRVNAALPGKQPAVRRGVLCVWQRSRHMRLQYAVAADHPASCSVPHRLVARVGRHAHQLAQAPGRQLSVAVQRQHVAHRAGQARVFTQVNELTLRSLRQRTHQLLQLAAFALPANPALLGVTELTAPVQNNETRRAGAVQGVAGVELAHLSHGGLQQVSV